MNDCMHAMIDLDYIPQARIGSNVIVLTIRASCRDCGPLRCIGVDEGLSLHRPSTSTDGCTIFIPVVSEMDDPEGTAVTRRLAS